MRYDHIPLPTALPIQGRTVFLLGTAKDGPVNAPVPIENLREAEAVFGSHEEGDLVRSYMEAAKVEGNVIYLMRINGESARGTVEVPLGDGSGETEALLTFRSIYAGEEYNATFISVQSIVVEGEEKKALVIETTKNEMTDRAYVLENFPTLGDLVRRINEDTRFQQSTVHASTKLPKRSPSILQDAQSLQLTRGTGGLNESLNDIYIALEESYGMLEGYHVDVINPVAVRFNDTYPASFYGEAEYGTDTYAEDRDYLSLVDTERGNRVVTFHEQLIRFCEAQESLGFMTHGVLGLREVVNTDKWLNREMVYVESLSRGTHLGTRYGLTELRLGDAYDKGLYLSIIAGELLFDGRHTANGGALYASLLAGNGVESTTNVALPDGVTLRFEFTSNELKQLSQLGVTTFRESPKKGPVVANGVTAALPDSEYRSIANVRMVQMTLHRVNQELDDLIGQTYIPVVTQKDIENRLDNVLRDLKVEGILMDYDYTIRYDAVENTGEIHLQILSRYSVEYVETSASIAFQGQSG